MLGEALTRWTIRLALTCLVLGAAGRSLSPAGCRGERASRWLWTSGCLLYLAHVACAFRFFHGWSHQAAYRETARQTEELFGLHWGGGLYFNYLFTLVWLADAAWWWLSAASYRQRNTAWSAAINGFLWFMVFNATVVFETGPIRWLGLAACALLLLVWRAAAGQGPLCGPWDD